MGDQLGLKKSTVAEYYAVGMPKDDPAKAREWMAKNVRTRKVDLRARGQAGALARKEAVDTADCISRDETSQDPEKRDGAASASTDFDEDMLRADEALLRAARSQVEHHMKSGDRIAFADAVGSYSRLAKEVHATRLRWLDSKKRAASLVDIDEVKAALTPHIAHVRRAFVKLGDRIAAKVNPGNPAHAKAVIDEEVDSIFATYSVAERDLGNAFTAPDSITEDADA